MKSSYTQEVKRLLGRIEVSEFVGRHAELERLTALDSTDERAASRKNLVVIAAPTLGATELLRQAYDRMFAKRGDDREAAPIYFAFSRTDQTSVAAARRFLHTFLLQFIAHKQNNASLLHAQPMLHDLLDVVSPSDYEWVEQLIDAYDRASSSGEERAFVRLCLSAPQRAAARGARSVIMLDHVHSVEELEGETTLGTELAHLVEQTETPFVLCGLRRRVMDVICATDNRVENLSTLHLDPLAVEEAHSLVEILSERHGISISDAARDLIIQQCAGNPFYITSLIDAIRESGRRAESFLDCQKIYVDELMGGRINRRFEFVIDKCAEPDAHARRTLLRLLHEAIATPNGKFPAEAWRRKLNQTASEFADTMRALHAYELVNFTTTFVEVEDNTVWRDYLRIKHRLQVNAEPRALIIAETLLEILKRAPRTLERSRRRAASLNVADVITHFDRQNVPASLLHYDRFVRTYKGADADEIEHGLEAEIELVRLPQIVSAASCAAFHPPMADACEPEHCMVAHGFEGDVYADGAEIIWLTTELETTGEVGRGLAELWCDRLMAMARACRLRRIRLWLIASEGFSAEASELLREREVYSSNRHQLEFLKERIGISTSLSDNAMAATAAKEFEFAIPVGEDAELIAAQAVEQVARRSEFSSDAINQIKTALVEACISTSDQIGASRDRKIYQRFRIEDDRLIVTISSRTTTAFGFPRDMKTKNGSNGHTTDDANGRRRWSLNLIRSLMDEVEFERGADGTRLRMTKYLRTQNPELKNS
jgi:anti-sigma regulatory factor (Ser/Thr protein kinase)